MVIKRIREEHRRFLHRFKETSAVKVGAPPGSLVHVGTKKAGKVGIEVIDYDAKKLAEHKPKTIEACFRFRKTRTTTWLDITGLHDTALIEKLGTEYGLHQLVMEDILNTGQRPKIEDFGDYIFITAKMLFYDEEKQAIIPEQVSLIVGSSFLISLQEREGDLFEPVRERLRAGKKRIRADGPGYLAYALMDAIVDHYFVILEKIGSEIEELEEQVAENPRPESLRLLHQLKREMIFLRKSVWPIRDIVNTLLRSESRLFKPSTRIYLRDLYDHTVQVIETLETARDMLTGMLDLYMSSISNRMNEIMKVLTIFAAIFIPLTFVAGVYGMNFENMPELSWQYGYFAVLGFMFVVGALMAVYFRRKKWL